MFFISLALLAQDVPVDADTAKAAPQCARVYMANTPSKDFSGFAQQLYLGMTAVRAKGGAGDDFLTNSVMAMAEAMGPASEGSPTVATCDARFPLARSTTPAKLPEDPADRDILCTGVVSMVAGASQRIAKDGDTTLRDEAMPLLAPFVQRFEAARKVRKIGEGKEAMARAISDSMRAALDRGNLEALFLSCKKLPG